MKIAINGFGRIGKQFLLAAIEKNLQAEFVINEHGPIDYVVYSLRYDSVHPSFKGTIRQEKDFLFLENRKIKVYSIPDPEKLPWKKEGVDIVVECTGLFTQKEDAEKHIKAGAKKILISAPAKNHDITIVIGVNDNSLKKEHKIISAGSCTTNSVSPILKIINDAFKIQSAIFITTHAYTATQRLIDGSDKKDFRRGRAAAVNISPSTSGASQSVIEAIPELKGKLSGYALRVPVVNGSISSIIACVNKKTDVRQVNDLFKKKSLSEMKGILSYTEEPIVSTDIIHDSSSCIFDASLTSVIGNTISVAGWYDNEWGYSNRLVDVVELLSKNN